MSNNDFMNLGLANITQGQNTQTAGLLDMFKDTPEEKALEQIYVHLSQQVSDKIMSAMKESNKSQPCIKPSQMLQG